MRPRHTKCCHVIRIATLATQSVKKPETEVIWAWNCFCMLTSKRASRHNGEQFFISHLTRWPCPPLWRTFRPPGTTIWKPWNNNVSRLAICLPFRAPCFSFFCLSLFWSSAFCIGFSDWLIPVLLLRHSISGKFDFSNFLRLGDSLHLNTGFMLRYELFTRTWTQSSCYATECSRALASAHRLLVRRLFSLHLPIDLISCYAKKGLLPHAQGPKWCVTRCLFAIAQRFHATRLGMHLRLRKNVTLRFQIYLRLYTHPVLRC